MSYLPISHDYHFKYILNTFVFHTISMMKWYMNFQLMPYIANFMSIRFYCRLQTFHKLSLIFDKMSHKLTAEVIFNQMKRQLTCLSVISRSILLFEKWSPQWGHISIVQLIGKVSITIFVFMIFKVLLPFTNMSCNIANEMSGELSADVIFDQMKMQLTPFIYNHKIYFLLWKIVSVVRPLEHIASDSRKIEDLSPFLPCLSKSLLLFYKTHIFNAGWYCFQQLVRSAREIKNTRSLMCILYAIHTFDLPKSVNLADFWGDQPATGVTCFTLGSIPKLLLQSDNIRYDSHLYISSLSREHIALSSGMALGRHAGELSAGTYLWEFFYFCLLCLSVFLFFDWQFQWSWKNVIGKL